MTTDGLRAALRGVRGLVLDADGVLVLQAKALPGSVEAVRSLDERGIPFRVVTNFSQLHRETLAIRQRVLGPEHPDTVESLYDLAVLAALQGDRAETLSRLRSNSVVVV